MDNLPLYSRHILLFPFQWKLVDPLADSSIRTQLPIAAAAVQVGVPQLDPDGKPILITESQDFFWRRESVNRTSSTSAYSEHNYLHDFVHGAVFDTGTPTAVYNFVSPPRMNLPVTLGVRNYALSETLRQPSDSNGIAQLSRTFRLTLFLARLNLYETGVGMLTLFLDNFEQRSSAEVLAINDVIRRLYPPRLDYKTGIESIKSSGLIADWLHISAWEEDFSAFPTNPSQQKIPAYFLPNYILGLLGPKFKVDPAQAGLGDVVVQHVLDDRMFLVGLLEDADQSERLRSPQADAKAAYLDDPFWYSFVFVDPATPQVNNQAMLRRLIEEATYPRWTEDGTFYGICRYAFMVLTGKGYIVKNPITGNYTRLVELCLLQRASVLRFREEASAIGALIAMGDRSQEVAVRIRAVYGDYIRFINRFYFLEATAVEQGIELYDLLRKQLRVQEQVEALRIALEEMHSYATLLQEEAKLTQEKTHNDKLQLQEETRNQTLYALTVISAAFLLPSLVLAYFGLADDWKRPLAATPGVLAGFLALGGLLAALLVYFRWLQQRDWRFWLGAALIGGYLWLLYVLPHLIEWQWL